MIEEFVKSRNLPQYRLTQFNQAFYRELINTYGQLTTWPKELREELKLQVPFTSLKLITSQTSAKGDTTKVLFQRNDSKKLETVLMWHKDGRNTICVSSMIGCPVGCRFCATGKLGFGGNLTAQEIVDQVLYFARILKKEGQKVTNVVFMGMGEPLLNLEAVLGAIKILTDPEKLGLSQRRITISTSGFIPQFKQLIASGFRGRMAISLHAPNQSLREFLMPVAKKYPLPELMKTIDEYVKLTNKRVSYEYLLIKGLNDQDEQAKELGKLLRHRLHHVNLIPFNPVKGEDFVRPERGEVIRFSQLLERYGVHHTIRVTMGKDISAACGQLAGKNNS